MSSRFLKSLSILFSVILGNNNVCCASVGGIPVAECEGTPKGTYIQVIRHAETPVKGVVHADDSEPITEEGYLKLYAFGQEKADSISSIICGPQARQLLSASAVAEGGKSSGKEIPIFQMQEMQEVDLCGLKGKSKEDTAKVAEKLRNYLSHIDFRNGVDEKELPFEGERRELVINCIETLRKFFTALTQLIKEDQRKGGGGNILVFTSSGVINLWMQRFFLDKPFDPHIPNCAAYTVVFDPCSEQLKLLSGDYQILDANVEPYEGTKPAVDMSKLRHLSEDMPEKSVTPTPLHMTIVRRTEETDIDASERELAIERTEECNSELGDLSDSENLAVIEKGEEKIAAFPKTEEEEDFMLPVAQLPGKRAKLFIAQKDQADSSTNCPNLLQRRGLPRIHIKSPLSHSQGDMPLVSLRDPKASLSFSQVDLPVVQSVVDSNGGWKCSRIGLECLSPVNFTPPL